MSNYFLDQAQAQVKFINCVMAANLDNSDDNDRTSFTRYYTKKFCVNSAVTGRYCFSNTADAIEHINRNIKSLIDKALICADLENMYHIDIDDNTERWFFIIGNNISEQAALDKLISYHLVDDNEYWSFDKENANIDHCIYGRYQITIDRHLKPIE